MPCFKPSALVCAALSLSLTLPLLAQTKPATAPSAPPATALPDPASFPPVPPDPIERPEFRKTPHPINKDITSATAMMIRMGSDGSMLGMTSDIIATVPPETRSGKAFLATFVQKQADVGPEMKTSFDEALRAVKLRYPLWEPGRIEFSFGEKYTPHDGGSAGTCFATMLLSHLEGFSIDPKCAVTGDITVDWKVRKIGGTAAKLRGATADKCLYAGIPLDNTAQLPDMLLLYGDASLRDIQIFSLTTLQDAVALLRTDRTPQLTEAMKEFADLQPKLKFRTAYNTPDTKKTLEHIIALAPNHESAKSLLAFSKGTNPKFLSAQGALYNIMVTIYPYQPTAATANREITRQTVPIAITQNARKQFGILRPITPKEILPILNDAMAIVETTESIINKTTPTTAIDAKRESLYDHLQALKSDKSFIEKLIREGI